MPLDDSDTPYHVDFTPNAELFPFESRWLDSSIGRVHYIDEGEGRPLLLMHGNPDWSFLYRKMIPVLAPHFKCVAMDYPGFGLSVHPSGYSYLPREHAAIVAELVEHLDLQDAVLVGQDWGGPIGFDVASRMPERFTGLVAGNTMIWPSTFFMQRTFSKITGRPFVQRLLVERHLFVKRLMKSLIQTPISNEELRHYVDVAPSPHSRLGHAIFPKAIVGETEWLTELERRVTATLTDRPMLRIMGMKDIPMTTRAFLRKWDEMWPDATKLDLRNAGHFWQEDEPETAAAAIIAAYATNHRTRPRKVPTMPNATLLITLAEPDPEQLETFHSYVEASTQLALDAGGRVSSRFGVRHIYGDAPAAVFGLATFPSADAITQMFKSDAYQKLIPARGAGLDFVNAYIAEDPALTSLPELTGESVYLVTVADPFPDASEDLARYQQAVRTLAAKHGAGPVAQYSLVGQPVGDTAAGFVAVAKFPSADMVKAFFDDEDYAAVADIRDRALRSLNLYTTS